MASVLCVRACSPSTNCQIFSLTQLAIHGDYGYNMNSVWKLDEIHLDDLSELERELVQNIEKLDGRPKDLKRVANMVTTKINLVRALKHAERILESQQGVK